MCSVVRSCQESEEIPGSQIEMDSSLVSTSLPSCQDMKETTESQIEVIFESCGYVRGCPEVGVIRRCDCLLAMRGSSRRVVCT